MKGVTLRAKTHQYQRIVNALLVSNGVSIGFFLARIAVTHSWRYSFLVWNLVLAWLPLLMAWLLVRRLDKESWRSGLNILLVVLWLGFLPNSFYIISDFVHLTSTGEIGLLYDIVLFTSFVFNGLVSGFASIFLLHRQFLKQLDERRSTILIGLVITSCAFAIYLGRYLRWNTWDVLVNPAGLLFDVSDRIINPAAHPQAFVTTFTFALLIGSMYMVIWQFIRAIKDDS